MRTLIFIGITVFCTCCAFTPNREDSRYAPPQRPVEPIVPEARNTAPEPLYSGEFATFSARPGITVTALAFPTGKPETSAVLLRRAVPGEIQVQQPFEFMMEICNLTPGGLGNVQVHEAFPEDIELRDASAKFASDGSGLIVWQLGMFEPGECRVVRASAIAEQVGALASCSRITYDAGFCTSFNVTQASLDLTCSLPHTLQKCDDVPVLFTLSNTGTGTARGVILSAELPSGIVAADGGSTFSVDVGTLESGQSRELNTALKALDGGEYTVTAKAESVEGLATDSVCGTFTVTQPLLEISTRGRARQILGRPVCFDVEVKNVGTGIAAKVRVQGTRPDGTVFLKATEDGQQTDSGVAWDLGDLPPDASRQLSVCFSAEKGGSLKFAAQAEGICAEPVSDTMSTELEGVAAMLLEVVDVSDPVFVGENETYFIRVTNQGSAAGSGIRITSELEDSMEYVSSSGPTTGTFENGRLTFEPLASLQPSERTEWKVVVKAKASNDARFKVVMSTDQTSRPVEESEATHFYE